MSFDALLNDEELRRMRVLYDRRTEIQDRWKKALQGQWRRIEQAERLMDEATRSGNRQRQEQAQMGIKNAVAGLYDLHNEIYPQWQKLTIISEVVQAVDEAKALQQQQQRNMHCDCEPRNQ